MQSEEPTYHGLAPQLPGSSISYQKNIFLAENQGIRHLFWQDGVLLDNGLLTINSQREQSGYLAIIGGLGISPPPSFLWP